MSTPAWLGLAIAAMLTGCVSSSQHYRWGSYDPALYAYYKDPAQSAVFFDALAAILASADAHHQPVPPGIYAEYGYLWLQQGKTQAAIDNFKQEEAHWPESTLFMERMIRVAAPPGPPPVTQVLLP